MILNHLGTGNTATNSQEFDLRFQVMGSGKKLMTLGNHSNYSHFAWIDQGALSYVQ